MVEAKERREAAENAKEKAVKRQELLEEFNPITCLKTLQQTGPDRDTAKRIQRQIMWHRRIGGDVHITTGVHKMNKAEAWFVMIRAVRRHLSGTSDDEGNLTTVLHEQRSAE